MHTDVIDRHLEPVPDDVFLILRDANMLVFPGVEREESAENLIAVFVITRSSVRSLARWYRNEVSCGPFSRREPMEWMYCGAATICT